MENHDFSVVICVYQGDCSSVFSQCLRTIVENTLQPFEIVIVIDGPISHDLDQLVMEFDENTPICRVLRNVTNKGLAFSLNRGISNVKTDVVVRCDADDYNIAYRFDRLVSFLSKNHEIDVVGSHFDEVLEDGRTVTRRVALNHDDIVGYAERRCPINHPTVAFRKNVWDKVGGYPENLFLKEDYGFWILALGAGFQFRNLDESLVWTNVSYNLYERRGGLRYMLSEFGVQKMLRKHLNLSLMRSFIFGTARCVVVLMPNIFRQYVYLWLLRKNK